MLEDDAAHGRHGFDERCGLLRRADIDQVLPALRAVLGGATREVSRPVDAGEQDDGGEQPELNRYAPRGGQGVGEGGAQASLGHIGGADVEE